jgi:hypothetical protein
LSKASRQNNAQFFSLKTACQDGLVVYPFQTCLSITAVSQAPADEISSAKSMTYEEK